MPITPFPNGEQFDLEGERVLRVAFEMVCIGGIEYRAASATSRSRLLVKSESALTTSVWVRCWASVAKT
jgi:hypothetical protein